VMVQCDEGIRRRRGALCGYENACGRRDVLECPYSVCVGCPLNPKETEPKEEECKGTCATSSKGRGAARS